MLNFFYCIYYALIDGTWDGTRTNKLGITLNRVGSLLINMFGGNFETAQSFNIATADLTGYEILATILAVITMCMVCFAVFKLTKMVFSIFFGGR